MISQLRRISILAAIFFIACNEDFTPKGGYEERLAVYGILAGDRDTQYVRVFSTYNTTGFNPLENSVDPQVYDAVVSLSSGSSSVLLRDTLMKRSDTTRYQTLVHNYYVAGVRPLPSQTFQLSVNSTLRGSATASITIPGRAINFSIPNQLVITQPLNYPSDDVRVNVLLPKDTRGYVVRMFLEYETTPGTLWRLEVPVGLDNTKIPAQPVYPGIRRGASEGTGNDGFTLTHVISRQAYLYALTKAKGNLTSTEIRFKRAVFVLYSIDKNLYTYFNIVNGFQDPFSIRTDLPDFSNIQGGVGVFGGYTVDSAVVSLNTWIDS